ncbi:hypothetical protein MCEME33_00238 [Candidatus Pelagibacterales bacterium]
MASGAYMERIDTVMVPGFKVSNPSPATKY